MIEKNAKKFLYFIQNCIFEITELLRYGYTNYLYSTAIIHRIF